MKIDWMLAIPVAAFAAGVIAGIGFMILMIYASFNRARTAFNKSPEE